MATKWQGYSLCRTLVLLVFIVGLVTQTAWGTEKHLDNVMEKPVPRLVAQTGHPSIPPRSISFSPDGHLLASIGVFNNIKLWDVATGRELLALSGHGEMVNSITFSPDGRTLASGSSDNTVKLWDVTTGRELLTMRGHDFGVWSVAFSPDGRSLASIGGGSIKIWNVKSGLELATLKGHKHGGSSLAFSPDGHTLAVGGGSPLKLGRGEDGDYSIRLLNVATGKELRSFRGHKNKVNSIAFSPDGHTLASGSEDNIIALWDVSSGQGFSILRGHDKAVRTVVFSPDGRILASGSNDKTIKLWEVSSGKEIRSLSALGGAVAFSPDGLTIVTGGEKAIKQWDVASGQELRTMSWHGVLVKSVSFSPDGHSLASGNIIWDVATGKELRTLSGHGSGVISDAFSPDRRTLASGWSDGVVKLRDVETDKELIALTGHKERILSVSFSPDGLTLASGSADKTVKLWDVATGRELRNLSGHEWGVPSVTFSPDGRALATGGVDSTAKLWDVATGKELRTLSGHGDIVLSVAFSPNGLSLVSTSMDKKAKLWDVATGRVLQNLIGHEGAVTTATFSPDGHTLASVSWDNSVKLWDVATGKELRTFKGHNAIVTSVSFSPDGRFLASGSEDSTIRLWDPTTGQLIATLAEFDDGSWAVIDAEGRYDSSLAGNNPNLHWVVGLTPIALDQLKDRYYEPGLLQKVMGYNPEPLRAVPRLEDALAHLYPELQVKMDSAKPLQLIISLREQGGGYGKVRVRLNGKELTPDARNGRVLSNKSEQLILNIEPDQLLPAENVVDVVAWNAEGHLSSPPALVKLDGTRGNKRKAGDLAKTPAVPPTLYAIVSGVALYANPEINLTFSGKDAYDFAQALTVGAKRLFGTDKVKLQLFSDDVQKAAPVDTRITAQPPSRDNLQKAFALVAKEAKPNDIFVVFLSGHGVMSAGGEGDYYYLTRDAGGLNLSDPAVRKLWSVSSTELTEWIKQVRATKQMMVLDTCSAGGAIEKLTQQRAVPSSQIIALERLKDRTGFHVLAGAAADRASYETTRYGQGLLTRALLTGMKGAALRDNEFVDVARLFQYARDEVPKLAHEIGGIQAPLVASPRGDSFDIGEMLEADKRLVPLENVREMVLRGIFQDEILMNDTLKLSLRFNQRLRAESQVTARGRLVFVDADEFPDAWSVAGRYRKTPQGMNVDVRLFRNNEPKGSLQLTLSGDDNQQVEQLFSAVIENMNKEIRR